MNLNSYGIDRDFQRKIAGLRTDLDSFAEVEAYALMLSGYLMSEHELRVLKEQDQETSRAGAWSEYDVSAPRRDWPFLKLESPCKLGPDSPHPGRRDLGKQLEVGGHDFLKVWHIRPAIAPVREAERGRIRRVGGALGVGALGFPGIRYQHHLGRRHRIFWRGVACRRRADPQMA